MQNIWFTITRGFSECCLFKELSFLDSRVFRRDKLAVWLSCLLHTLIWIYVAYDIMSVYESRTHTEFFSAKRKFVNFLQGNWLNNVMCCESNIIWCCQNQFLSFARQSARNNNFTWLIIYWSRFLRWLLTWSWKYLHILTRRHAVISNYPRWYYFMCMHARFVRSVSLLIIIIIIMRHYIWYDRPVLHLQHGVSI